MLWIKKIVRPYKLWAMDTLEGIIQRIKRRTYILFHAPKSWGIPHFQKHVAHIELTSRCNIVCKACYRIGPLKHHMDLNVSMTMDQVHKLLSHYRPENVSAFVFSGGENLLHPDFFKIVSIIQEGFPGIPIVLSTNGIMLSRDKNMLDTLCTSGVTQMQFSLHGATQPTLTKLQKGIILDDVLAVINYIASHSRINVMINYVVQEENIGEVLPFIELIASKAPQVKTISFTPMNFAGHTEIPVNYHALWKKMRIKKVFHAAHKKALSFGITIPRFTPVCNSIFNVNVITARGDMLPCWGNYLTKKYHIGNVFKDSPDVIRSTPEFRKVQESIATGKVLPLCISCWANGKYRL